ncbi:hypothetical protein BJY52DRAFT_1402809 [Lactarius psammicola]|nr:hypothetical protein BJY52DRAFT_1402809 [Lactarius psammicola]
MALYGASTTASPSPAPTSQSHESSVNPPVIGQSGPSYQPNIYHPHIYPQYYNQSVPYSYSVQPTTQVTPAPAAPTTSNVPVAPPHSEPSPVPAPIPSKEAKTPVPAKRGPGRPRKQPAGEVTGGQIGKALAHFVEEAVPLGMNVWKRIERQYNDEYAIPNNRQERGWDNMQDKWYKIVLDNPSTGEGEMPDALNEVFRVNNILEDVGGLVDPEDLPEVESSNGPGRAYSGSGAGGNDELDNDTDYATPAKKNISPNAEARQNDNKAVMRLYLQQIRAQEETIWVRELQNDALHQEATNLQDKLQSTIHELSKAERRADKLEMRLEMLEMMGTHRGHSSQCHHAHHKWTLSSSPSSSSSASSGRHSQSPLRSVLKSKRCDNLLSVSQDKLETLRETTDKRGEEEGKVKEDKEGFKHKQEGKEVEQTNGGELRRRLRGLQVGVHKWTV